MAKKVFLEFERDIEALETKIDELRELEETEAKKGVSVASEIASLEAKEADVAVLFLTKHRSKSLEIRNLAHFPMALVVPAGHRFAVKGFWPKSDFSAERWIAIQEKSGGTEELLAGLSRFQFFVRAVGQPQLHALERVVALVDLVFVLVVGHCAVGHYVQRGLNVPLRAVLVGEVIVNVPAVSRYVQRLAVFLYGGEFVEFVADEGHGLERVVPMFNVVGQLGVHEVPVPLLGDEVGPHYQRLAVNLASACVRLFHLHRFPVFA